MNVTRNVFSETPPVAVPFREDVPIQGLRLNVSQRKECNNKKKYSNYRL